jgi:uncharacterized protein (DUF427 family)
LKPCATSASEPNYGGRIDSIAGATSGLYGIQEHKGTRHAAKSLVVSYRFPLPGGVSCNFPGKGWIERNRPERPMARAIWNGKVIAESDQTEEVDGIVFFPEASLKREYLCPSTTTSTDPSKGQARYMSLLVDGQDNQDAAWYFPDPKPKVRKIKGFVAFSRGVDVVK